MRILHVVTLVSTDGAFGGPLKVAMNQAEELRRRGHHVVLAAGWRGAGAPPASLQGTPARLFPVHRLAPTGFSGLFSPRLLRWLKASLPSFDIVHVHAGRDLITLPAMALVRRAEVPYVTQTHGMITVDTRAIARVLDALATRRLLAAARRHLVLTDAEQEQLPLVEARVRLHRVRNGVPVPAPEVVSGAMPNGSEVLYCARLQARKRPCVFVAMADLLQTRIPDASYAIVGPDEGELAAVQADIARRGLKGTVVYEGALPYDEVLARMRRAAVYVLPSANEPFPMSLLEALSVGVPSVITESCGISALLASRRAALVTDGSPEQLADAVEEVLVNPVEAARLSRAAIDAVREIFSIDAVVDDLERIYIDAISPLE